ncbi:hypothetical protein RhiJN_16711 [Ceratobasidium sp. AG-Ba]|nr:hypothetical protein RhiJN_16711 [Ceratobasidium sp. AG-Ba]
MEQSTQELQQRARTDPSGFDIEHLAPSTHEYIEMNLGLGVYESRANRQSSPHSSDPSDTDSSTSSSSSDSDSDSEDSDASDRPDVLSILMSAAPPVPRIPHPPARPNIVMIPSNEQPTSCQSP